MSESTPTPAASATELKKKKALVKAQQAARNRTREQRRQEKLATQVEVLMVLPGNLGLNNAPMYIRKTEPATAPGMHLLVTDADRRLLQERFDFKDLLSKKWRRSKKLTILQLKREPLGATETLQEGAATEPARIFKRNDKLFGAGGSPEAGRRAVKASSKEISDLMTGKDLILSWVGAGGGTGTAVAEEVARLAKERSLPLITFLTMPSGSEASKIAIADNLRVHLRDYSRLMVFKNGNVPSALKGRPTSEVHLEINRGLDPIFRHFTEMTQREGTTSNSDFEDLMTVLERATDLYGGSCDISLESEGEGEDKRFKAPATLDTNNVVDEIMSHTYQSHDIQGAAMIVVFVGPWTYQQQEDVVVGLKTKVKGGEDMFIKVQSREVKDEMWVSVIISGSFPSDTEGTKPEAAKVASLVEFRPNGPTVVPKQNGGNVPYMASVDGRRVELHVPQVLVDRWQAELARPRRNMNELMKLRDEFANFGPRPDITREAEPVNS